MRRLRFCLLVCTVFLPLSCTKPCARPPSAEAVRHLNLGTAFLEQYKYGQAEREYRLAAELVPEFVEARIDLAVALVQQVKYPAAEAELARALACRPQSVNARYVSGLIAKYKGDKDAAIAAFEAVRALDPDDTDTKYNLGLIYKDRGAYGKAIPLLEEVVRAAPHFVSAYYALGQSCVRAGQEAKDAAMVARGEAYTEQFRKLAGGATAETAGLRYGEQGRYALAVEYTTPLAPRKVPAIRFADAAKTTGIAFTHGAASSASPAALGSGVLVFDLDLDGDEDVLLLGSADGLAAHLYRNDGSGHFADETEKSHLGDLRGAATGVAAGDVDGDGIPDLLLAGRLLHAKGDGTYADVTADSGLEGALAGAASVSFADLDHDGDLDLVATFPDGGGVRAWQNAKGHFTEVTEEAGLGGKYAALSLTFTDFDNDRDIDFLVGVRGAAPRLFTNERSMRFKDVAAAAGLTSSGPTLGVAAADVDGDGFPDLFVTNATATSHALYRNRGNGTFTPATSFVTASAGTSCLFVDADLDGDLDLFVGEKTGIRFFRNDGSGKLTEATKEVGLDAVHADVRGLAAGDLDGDGDPDLVANVFGGPALVLLNQGAEASQSWVKVAPRGLNSNKTALGTKLEVHAASLHEKIEVQGAQGFLSQGPQTVTFGLDGETGVDRVQILWPGGVLQAETDLARNQLHKVDELDRKGSSCPFLWTWDGHKMAFVSDIQGGSPLGLWVAPPDVHNLPDPDEWFLLPDGLAQPHDGSYDLRITESLEEIAYVDRAMLRVVDAPADVRVFPNERLLLMPPFAPQGLHFVRRTIPPVAAADERGSDVRADLAAIDRRYAGAVERDRFRGFAKPWTLDLDFGRLPPEARGKPVLLLAYGYVEFSNSTPMYAAAQAGTHLALPALDVLDDAGRVVTTIADAGAPAGLPKWMVLDLTAKLPAGGRVHVRYRTNLEVYFDTVMLGIGDPSTEHEVHDLEPATADLGFAGYPTRWSPDAAKPVLYRYDRLRSDETWTSQEGLYTRFGDVRELLLGEDDRMVVMSHGDELRLRFPADRLPPVPPGQARHLILYSVGYAKDLDPHSAAPLTVGPLPFRGMKSYPYEGPGRLAEPDYLASLERWSTRYVRPLASASLR